MLPDSEITHISHYPFRKFKVGKPPRPIKRTMTLDQMRMIRDFDGDLPFGGLMAKELFMLSFY